MKQYEEALPCMGIGSSSPVSGNRKAGCQKGRAFVAIYVKTKDVCIHPFFSKLLSSV